MLEIIYLIIIIICEFGFFALPVPVSSLTLTLVGKALILLGVIVYILRSKELWVLRNPITWMIICYFLLIGVHVALASFYYDQSILRGIIRSRTQAEYLSFFLFLLALSTPEKIKQFINAISILALSITFISLVNYFGIPIFEHRWAEGHGIRGGIVRAYVPGLELMTLSCFWFLNKTLLLDNFKRANFIGFSLLLGIHFLRQTRSRILSLLAVIVALLLGRRQFKALFLLGAIALITVSVINVFMKENIIVHSVASVFEELQTGGGTWEARDRDLRIAIEEFMRHPIIGSGIIVLSEENITSDPKKLDMYNQLTKMDDSGYFNWLKAYGLVGGIWLLFFYIFIFSIGRRTASRVEGWQRAILDTGLGYMGFVVINTITIPNFVREYRIMMVCLASAIIIRIYMNKEAKDT